jgi:hypothetical protein
MSAEHFAHNTFLIGFALTAIDAGNSIGLRHSLQTCASVMGASLS